MKTSTKKLSKQEMIESKPNKIIMDTLANEPKVWIIHLIATFIVLAIMYWSKGAINFRGIQSNGVVIAKNIFTGLINPDWSLLLNLTRQGIPFVLMETLAIAFLGTFIGAILAIPLAFISASNMVSKHFTWLGVFIIAAIRTFPPFVYGIMFIRVTGPGPFAGVLTLAITSIGMIAKLYIEAIEDIDKKILESLDASGCNTIEKIRYGILPQLMTNFVSTVIYRYEINIKNASILGLVGAGGIGAPLIFAMSAYRWREVGAILVGLIILVLIVEYFSTAIRTKLARG
ncbi:phosphonate ABC transporter, permease protein PhnE [Alkaliphilus transvaalensis]|uniref:phosphonate ABC transporter, permease protein PhnE n=1 Tax=Alkaliphilus transvaalensis TaxID=114628 RepID=UPI000AADCA44|nr:phosphonate ABC transporter, permease protein PhnE [Alkaliphilus transvaalensis]